MSDHVCPVHQVTDCAPLLDGCTLLDHVHRLVAEATATFAARLDEAESTIAHLNAYIEGKVWDTNAAEACDRADRAETALLSVTEAAVTASVYLLQVRP